MLIWRYLKFLPYRKPDGVSTTHEDEKNDTTSRKGFFTMLA